MITAVLGASSVGWAQVGKRYPSERRVEKDGMTGASLIVLTNGTSQDEKIYQTHPQWTSDAQYIVFSSKGRSPERQIFAVHEQTGDIVQLTDSTGIDFSSLNVARSSMKLVYLRNVDVDANGAVTHAPNGRRVKQVVQVNLASLLADSKAGAMKPASTYERVIEVPKGFAAGGGSALDYDDRHLYVAFRGGDVGTHLPPGTPIIKQAPGSPHGSGPCGIRVFDLDTGAMSFVLDAPFNIGHVQANPFVTGEVLYCHETGGDAEQRMWFAKADGSVNRPLYPENPSDWVTHEAVVTPDEVMFNLIGFDYKQRQHPTGIAVVNLRTNAVEIIGQVDEQLNDGKTPGGFWHCNGTADGRLAVGDTLGGNLWLIDRASHKMTLLSTDHKMKPYHAHPSFSADGSRILINSGRFSDGKTCSLIVIPIPKQD